MGLPDVELGIVAASKPSPDLIIAWNGSYILWTVDRIFVGLKNSVFPTDKPLS